MNTIHAADLRADGRTRSDRSPQSTDRGAGHRLTTVRRRIAAGDYRVPADEVAAAIILLHGSPRPAGRVETDAGQTPPWLR